MSHPRIAIQPSYSIFDSPQYDVEEKEEGESENKNEVSTGNVSACKCRLRDRMFKGRGCINRAITSVSRPTFPGKKIRLPRGFPVRVQNILSAGLD